MRLLPENRTTALSRLGYELYTYNGRVSDAPRQIKHLLHGQPSGIYVVDYRNNRVAGNRLEVKKEERPVQAYLQAAKDYLNRQGWLFSQIVSGQFIHFDTRDDQRASNQIMSVLDYQPDGYYAVLGKQFVGPFYHAIDLVDELMQMLVPKVLKGFKEVASTANDSPFAYQFTAFNNDRGGVITEGPVDQGLVLAYVSAFEGSERFGRMATLGPYMFELMYQFSIASNLNDSRYMRGLQNAAIELVGYVNS